MIGVQPMIKIDNLIKRVGDKVILKGVSLNITKGETVGILGPNGAGKSTLLKVIATLLKPTSGEVTIDGLDLKKDPIKIKSKLGYLPHASLLYDHFTPYENLKFFSKVYYLDNVEERIHKLIDDVGLRLFTHEPVKSFSRGMVQRIAIARSILHDPEILLLDEPHTGLDQQAIGILNNVVAKLQERDVTTLIVTHDFLQAAKVCDRIVIVRNGRIADDFLLDGQDINLLQKRYQSVVEGDSNAI
ncbi:MAG: heme exporter protein CcmA [Bacillales bacterium]|jgi:heme exporter protein A|nr:heme exporter protein CcmA [Bacillales bacterium]